jgi:hypothetical protein
MYRGGYQTSIYKDRIKSDTSNPHSTLNKDVMPGATLPPFPDDVPTHPLLIVDYALIKAGDESEIDKLWKAATELGFW